MQLTKIKEFSERLTLSYKYEVSKSEIEEFESKYDISLPEDYGQFLLIVNGKASIHSNTIFEEIPENGTDYLGEFGAFNVLESNYTSLIEFCEESFNPIDNPEELLIISNTVSVPINIAIGVKGERSGQIFWIDARDLDDVLFIKLLIHSRNL